MIAVVNKFVHSAPRKARLILNEIVGMNPTVAIAKLRFLANAVSIDIEKTVKSALASAKDKNIDQSTLIISKAYCNEGPKMKRRIVASRGRSRQIIKRKSHIHIELNTPKSKAE